VPLDEPAWWYQERPTFMARALAPVARLWGLAAERRFRRGEGYQSAIPVICVGNFTAGGTGKTPLALHLAGELARIGAKPAFLSRGYGGRIAGPHWVSPAQDSAQDVGDEPLLLARAGPTLIARNRADGARAIAACGAGYGTIVMDDGLQNGSLAKCLAIAVVDARRGVGNGCVIPAGPLRAPLAFQLNLIDAVVVNRAEGAGAGEASIVGWLRDQFTGPVISATTEPQGDTSWLQGADVVAFCGIGAPERFFDLLERLGARVVARRAFRDHYVLSEREARDLLATAHACGAILVTTEKDHVRLAATGRGAQAALRAQSRVLAIRLALQSRDRIRLAGLIEASLTGGRRG
jgi:tetraacyldisaccharide 4'-kinase